MAPPVQAPRHISIATLVNPSFGRGLCERLRIARSLMSGKQYEDATRRASLAEADSGDTVVRLRLAIDFAAYFGTIFEDCEAYSRRQFTRVQLTATAESFFIAVPATIILGLAIAELLACAFDYAAAENTTGRIGVHLWATDSSPARAHILVAHTGGSFSNGQVNHHIANARKMANMIGARMTCELGYITIWRIELGHPIVFV